MLKLTNYIFTLMILCGGFHLSQGEKLNCKFKDHDYVVVGSYYTCYVNSLDNSFNNMTIDGYTGTDKVFDLKAIWIENTSTTYIPANFGFFSKLIAFLIQKSQLVEIKAENFLGMNNLEYLSLQSNNLTSVPSDAFSFLPKLKIIWLDYNQIKFIGSGVFDKLTILDDVFLKRNICVDNNYKGRSTFLQLKDDIKAKCQNSNEISMLAELSLSKDELKTEQEKNTKVTNERDQLKEELTKAKETFEQKLFKMEQTINGYYSEVMNLKIECQNEIIIGLSAKLMKAREQCATFKIDHPLISHLITP
ncbi:unnamed protein product [Diamesa hyperborea]